MATTETLTVNLSDGYVYTFSVSDGNGAIYAADIESGGISIRKVTGQPMVWYGPNDISNVTVHDNLAA